jgi:hypothetical protein
MRDSTRIKLKMAEQKLENSSNYSDAFVRIYNRSLKDNYNTWLLIEKKSKLIMERLFGMDSKIVRFTAWVGRCAINVYKRAERWCEETRKRHEDEMYNRR